MYIIIIINTTQRHNPPKPSPSFSTALDRCILVRGVLLSVLSLSDNTLRRFCLPKYLELMIPEGGGIFEEL